VTRGPTPLEAPAATNELPTQRLVGDDVRSDREPTNTNGERVRGRPQAPAGRRRRCRHPGWGRQLREAAPDRLRADRGTRSSSTAAPRPRSISTRTAQPRTSTSSTSRRSRAPSSPGPRTHPSAQAIEPGREGDGRVFCASGRSSTCGRTDHDGRAGLSEAAPGRYLRSTHPLGRVPVCARFARATSAPKWNCSSSGRTRFLRSMTGPREPAFSSARRGPSQSVAGCRFGLGLLIGHAEAGAVRARASSR
jgi:hypothetical protein